MSEEEKELSGKIFNAKHPELIAIKRVAHNLCTDYNLSYEHESEKRSQILAKLLGKCGHGVYFQGPIYFNYGTHTTIGDHFFGNYNIMISDDAPVTIGDHVMIGPNCTLATPAHPLIPEERRYIEEKTASFSVHVWQSLLSSEMMYGWPPNVTVCGGVTIGDGAVIGAGSVVLRDIPPRVLAAGNPCKVIREITDTDSIKHRPELF